MKKKQQIPAWTTSLPELANWYTGGLGQSILSDLDAQLRPVLSGIFGYRGLQLGHLSDDFKPMQYAGIHRPVTLDPNGHGDICGNAMSLPVATQTMKLVVLPHTLDICEEPYQVLREVDRVLTDDGHVVIIGFNPWSLMGLRRAVVRWQRGSAPWNGHFYARHRLTEWLSVLNFKVSESRAFHLRPPINSLRVQSRLSRIESLQPWFGGLGSAYVLYAQKQTLPLTPARGVWRRSANGLRVGGFAGSTNRDFPRPVTAPAVKPDRLRVVAGNNTSRRTASSRRHRRGDE